MTSIGIDHGKTRVNEKAADQEEIRNPNLVVAIDTIHHGKDGLTTRVDNRGVDLNMSSKNKSGTNKNQLNQTGPQPKFQPPKPHDLSKLTSNFQKPTTYNNNPTQQIPSNIATRNAVPIGNTLPKSNQIPEPPAFTIIHSYAAKLRANQANNEVPIELSPPIFSTRQGLPTVIFKKEDFMNTLAKKCKYTLVGKFSNTMPKME